MLAVAGGVAANARDPRARSRRPPPRPGPAFLAPPLALCTDNGAMIAWAAAERMAVSARPTASTLPARPRWPLDAAAAPMLGAGRKGAKA